MELSLLKMLLETLAEKEAVLADMRAKGDECACDYECRLIGYKNAITDVQIAVEADLNEMADEFEERDGMPAIWGRDGKRLEIRPLEEVLSSDSEG